MQNFNAGVDTNKDTGLKAWASSELLGFELRLHFPDLI